MDVISTPINDENAAHQFGGRGKELNRSRSFGSALKEITHLKGGKSDGKRRVLGNITNSTVKSNLLGKDGVSNSKSTTKSSISRGLRILEVEEVKPRRLQLPVNTKQRVKCDLDPSYVSRLAQEYAKDGVEFMAPPPVNSSLSFDRTCWDFRTSKK